MEGMPILRHLSQIYEVPGLKLWIYIDEAITGEILWERLTDHMY